MRRGGGVFRYPVRSSIRRRRRFVAVAVLGAALLGGEGWAQEPEPTESGAAAQEAAPVQGGAAHRIGQALETAEGWIARGESEKGLSLLRDLLPVAEAHGADTTPIRFLMAQALMRLRRHEEAALLLAELVAGGSGKSTSQGVPD